MYCIVFVYTVLVTESEVWKCHVCNDNGLLIGR